MPHKLDDRLVKLEKIVTKFENVDEIQDDEAEKTEHNIEIPPAPFNPWQFFEPEDAAALAETCAYNYSLVVAHTPLHGF